VGARCAGSPPAMLLARQGHRIASLQPPDEQMSRLAAAIAGNQPAMDAFARLNSGMTSPAEFFAPENISRLLGGPAS
jgi:hypothetical protein